MKLPHLARPHTALFLGAGWGALVLSALVAWPGTWYMYLERPALAPTGWILAVAWWLPMTVLALVVGAIWTLPLPESTPRAASQRGIAGLYGLVVVFTAVWHLVLFHLHDHRLTMAAAAVLASVVLLLVLLVAPRSRGGAVLLLPVLAWFGYVAWLTWRLYVLNLGGASA